MTSQAEHPLCSRAGCRAEATRVVLWRNPRIHAPDRQKTWHACDEHAPYLHDYLAARGFPVVIESLPAAQDAPGAAS